MPVKINNNGFDFKKTFEKAVSNPTPSSEAQVPDNKLNFKETFEAGLKKKVATPTSSDQSSTPTTPSSTPSEENNSFTDQLVTWFKKGQEEMAKRKAEEEENRTAGKETSLEQARKQGGLAILKKTTAIQAPNGVKIELDTKAAPNYDTHTFNQDLKDLQERVNTGKIRPEDVSAIATLSKKTPEATAAYLTGDTTKGLAIDNVETQKKLKTDLSNSILQYNSVTGESLVPDEVLGSPDKTVEFIQKIKDKKRSLLSGITPDKVEANPSILNEFLNPESFLTKANEYQQLLTDHIVYKTIEENEKNGVPKEQTIKDIARRRNPDDYYKSIKANVPVTQTPLNPLAGAGQLYGNIFGTQEKDDLLNSQYGIAEFEYNNQQKQIANDQISQGILTGDENLVNQGKARMDATMSDSKIYQKYPALLKQKIAQEVSKEIAFRAGQLPNSETKDYSMKFFGATKDDLARTDAMKKYLSDPATKDIAESMLDNTDLFADASYLGGMMSSMDQPFKELFLSVGDITQFRTNKDVYTDLKREEMFPKEVEGTKADFTILNHPFKVRTALNTTANLAGMMAIAVATEGIGTELGATAKVAKSLGAYTSFGLPSYDAALKDSYNFLDNDAARTLYATISAITNAEGGRFLDLGKTVRIPGVSDVYAKMADKLSKGELTKTAYKELSGEAKNAYVDFAVKYGKNVSKGAATMAYFGIANNIEKIAFGDPNTNVEDIAPQAAHAFIDGVLGMSIMGAFGATSEMRAEKNTTYKGFIYNMALNHDATKDVFDIGLKNGTYNQQQYNEKVQILNTARAAKNAMDAAQQETNIQLDTNQKSVYVANKTAEALLREKAANKNDTDANRDKYEAQADRLRMQSTQTLDGLKFTPTLEPLYDLYHAEKEYDQALADFNEKKGSEKTLEEAKNNYDDLINKYFAKKGLEDLAAEKLNPKPTVPESASKAIEEGIKSGQISDVEAKLLNTTENRIEFLKQVAMQAKGEFADGTKVGEGGEQGKATRKTYGNEIVDEALKMFPVKAKEVKDIPDSEISKTAAEVAPFIPKEQSDQVKSVFDRVNKAEQINEKELADTENVLYDVLDKHPNAAHLIEPLISKIQDYEFATKTETGTVTEEVSTETPRQTRKREPVSKNLDQWEGNRATTTDANGKQVSGVLRIENGKYSLYNENGEKVAALGEKAITDRDITLPSSEDVPVPIQVDKDGNVKSITLQLNKVDKENGGVVPDKQITIDFKDPEKALDYAIALRAEQIGEIDPKKFDMAYEEIQKEVSKEVPKSENKPIQSEQPSSTVGGEDISSQTKTSNDGNKESDAQSKSSGESRGKEGNGEKTNELQENGQVKVNKEGEGEPPSGSSKPSEGIDPDADKTVLSFKGLKEIADEFELDPVTSRERKSDKQLFEDAKNTITKWVKAGSYKKNVEKLVKSAENREVLNDEQRVIVQQHMANVRNAAKEAKAEFGINSKEYDASLLELKRVTKAGLLTRQAAGAALRIGGKGSIVRYDVPDMMTAKMEALNVDSLTDVQKKEVEKQSQDIEKKTITADEKVAMYEAQIAEYKAEKELSGISVAAKTKTKKTENEYKAERQSLKDKLKQQIEEYKTAGQKMGIASDGGAESFGISVKMAKTIGEIVKSHVEEVGNKLEEVTKRVLDEIKDIFPHVTAKDIQDVIAGKYTERGKTKSQLQVDLESLKTEAKLINKLEELENGKVPVSERAKTERNQNIKDLRDAIKASDVNKLNEIKKRNELAAEKIRERLAKGEFEKSAKSEFEANEEMKRKFPKQYAEAMDAIAAKENAQHEFEIGLLKDAQSKRGFGKKYIYDPVKDVIGTVKALRTGIDFSALFIQNIVPILSHPIVGAEAIMASFRDFASSKKFERALAELHSGKYWDLIQKSGLDITEPKSLEARNKEEIFNRNLLEKDLTIKGKKYNIGKYLTTPFERAFVSLGNHIRAISFLTMAETLEREGKTFESHPQEFKDLAKVLNTQTGRGVLPDFINKSTETVNSIIWSPRLMASRLNLLGLGDVANPVFAGRKGFYAGLTPRMRRKAAGDMVKFASTVIAIYSAAGFLYGMQTDVDPLSSTFGDIKDENTDKSYNMMGGFAQYIKLAAIMAMGERHLGEKTDDISDSKGKTRIDILNKFLRGKVTPLTGAAINTIEGKDYLGKPTTALNELKNMITPMSLSGIPQDMKRDGLVPAFVNGLISTTGISVKDERDYKKNNETAYSKDELKDPTLKFYTDKKIEIPETNPNSIKIEDDKTSTIKTLKDYGEKKVKEFDDLRKKYLKDELADLKEREYVYVDKFGRASLTSANGGKQTPLKDIDTKQLEHLVSLSSTKATKKAKRQIFAQ